MFESVLALLPVLAAISGTAHAAELAAVLSVLGLGAMLGDQRMKALWRLVVGGLYAFLFLTIIAPLMIVVGLVLGAVDIVWQFLFNSEGIMKTNLFTRSWDWTVDNFEWVITGRGSFTLWPF